MRPLWIYGCLLCLLAMQTSAAAQSSLKWTFQRTGFRSTMGASGMPQTALSMRSNLSWPVVYGFDQNTLNAYSLFPVTNTTGKVPVGPATNWHQIGTNLTGSPLSSSNSFLQADSGSPDGFGVSLQAPAPGTIPNSDVVVVGNSQAGFQPPQVGAQALKFDDAGVPLVATGAMLPNLPTSEKLFDIATSSFGDVAAITQNYSGNGQATYWQRSPLLGGNWLSTKLPYGGRNEEAIFGPSVDLAFDASSNPHFVGINRNSPRNNVAAYRFDITTGAWTSSILDTAAIDGPSISDVAAASSDDGLIGAAWVNKGALKYAYLDTNEASPQWVVTSVASTTPTGVPLAPAQGVGLAFDKAGLPVISFVDNTMRQIWVAYDPPSAFGGGVTDQPGAEGDFNGDGFVDGYDVDAWRTGFGEGTLSGADFLAWQRNISPPPAAAAAIPEPLTLSSSLIAGALLFGSTRKLRRRAN